MIVILAIIIFVFLLFLLLRIFCLAAKKGDKVAQKVKEEKKAQVEK